MYLYFVIVSGKWGLHGKRWAESSFTFCFIEQSEEPLGIHWRIQQWIHLSLVFYSWEMFYFFNHSMFFGTSLFNLFTSSWFNFGRYVSRNYFLLFWLPFANVYLFKELKSCFIIIFTDFFHFNYIYFSMILKYFKILCIWMFCLHQCITSLMCMVPMELRRGHWSPEVELEIVVNFHVGLGK